MKLLSNSLNKTVQCCLFRQSRDRPEITIDIVFCVVTSELKHNLDHDELAYGQEVTYRRSIYYCN